MKNWFKKLFCKHEWNMIIGKQNKSTSIKETKIGEYVRPNVVVGCSIYCKKCGKQKKRMSKFIAKIAAKTYIESYRNCCDAQIYIGR